MGQIKNIAEALDNSFKNEPVHTFTTKLHAAVEQLKQIDGQVMVSQTHRVMLTAGTQPEGGFKLETPMTASQLAHALGRPSGLTRRHLQVLARNGRVFKRMAGPGEFVGNGTFYVYQVKTNPRCGVYQSAHSLLRETQIFMLNQGARGVRMCEKLVEHGFAEKNEHGQYRLTR